MLQIQIANFQFSITMIKVQGSPYKIRHSPIYTFIQNTPDVFLLRFRNNQLKRKNYKNPLERDKK
jgi:hypothetical protein